MADSDLVNELDETLLMGPGPSCVPDAVYDALAATTVGHLDPRFIEIMDDIKSMLQQVFQTQNALTVPMSGTGSSGMETCFVNLVEPGDNVLILSNGVFGARMADVAGRVGADVDVLDFDWGTPVLADAVKAKLGAYAIVAVVHAETSTGVLNPVAEIGRLVKETEALYLVDSVTSLGGIPVKVDDWGIDAIYSGTQKCLSCPPGLAPVSFSEAAVAKLKARKAPVPSWYLDLNMIVNYWEGETRAYHHTAPVNMLYGLYAALRCLLEEGLNSAFARHKQAHDQLVAGLGEQGLELFVDSECRLPMLNAVTIPAGIDEAAIRATLLEDHDIEIGAGLGPLAGKIWRVGLMGHTAREANVSRFLDALKQTLA